MATEAEYIARALPAIRELANEHLALVKPEVISRLAEKYFDGHSGNLDQHIVSQALDHLIRRGELTREETPTRGGRPIVTYAPADRSDRDDAMTRAAARKRFLYTRYRGWAEGCSRYAEGLVGPAGEDVVRRSIMAAGTFTPEATGAGEVTSILNVTLLGKADSGGHMLTRNKNGDPSGWVTTVIEVKKVRDWLYPRSERIYQVLDKAAAVQRARPAGSIVPILICRAAAKVTFYMAKMLGFLVIDLHAQYIGNVDLEKLDEIRNELHFIDVKP